MGILREVFALRNAACALVAFSAVFAAQVALPTWRFYRAEVCMGEGGRYALRAAVSWYFGSRLIQGGEPEAVVPDCVEHMSTCEWQALVFSFYAVVGLVRVPAHCLREAGVQPPQFLDKLEEMRRDMPRHTTAVFCRSLLDYEHSSTPTIQATREDEEDFLKACRDEYRELKTDERMLLDPLHHLEGIPQPLLRSWDVHSEDSCTSSAVKHEDHGPEPQLPEEALAEAIQHGLEPAAERHAAPEQERSIWRGLDLRAPADAGRSLQKVGKPLMRGEIVRFDAVFRFGRGLWNMTVADLVELEGEEASRHIPVASPLPGDNAHSLAEHARRRSPGVGYVNAKRCRKLLRKVPDLAMAFNIEDNVLYVQHHLLLGRVRWPHAPPIGEEGCRASFQVNAEPNVYVQIRGETKLLLIPQRFSDDLTSCGQDKLHLPCGTTEDIKQLSGVPLVWAHLRPGDAIAFPARTHHIISVQSDDSIALNSLLLPNWRDFENTNHDYYTKAAKHSLENLALRQLWIQTLRRMHNTTGRAVYSNHGLLEWF